MHGLLADAEAMSHAQGWIEADFPGIYTHNVEIGNGRDDSMFMDINHQVDLLAASVASDPKLQNGFNLVCHSQGGLLCRAYIERYNNPPVHNFISWAGPHQGQYGVPMLNALCPDYLCPWLDWVMDLILDGSWEDQQFQSEIAFAAYWHDPFNEDRYKERNIFLADINNERDNKNQTYKKHFSSLNFVLLEYSSTENIVIPMQSPWFFFFEEDSDYTVDPMNQTDLYNQDWIGLKTLNEQGKVKFVSVPCDHQDIPRDTCKQYYDLYTKPLLNNTMSD
jgi:palmitoyl-protein thioesterase